MKINQREKSVMNKGFKALKAVTFIELLIVVIIIGVLSGLAVPRFKTTFETLSLENYVKDVYYLGRYLQTTASAQAKVFCLNIDKEKKELKASYQDEDKFIPLTGRFGKAYKLPEGVSVVSDPETKPEVYFYPDGGTDKVKLTFTNQYKKEISLLFQGAGGGIKIE